MHRCAKREHKVTRECATFMVQRLSAATAFMMVQGTSGVHITSPSRLYQGNGSEVLAECLPGSGCRARLPKPERSTWKVASMISSSGSVRILTERFVVQLESKAADGSAAVQPPRRDGSVETLRALALLSLVGFHASVEEPSGFITSGADHYDTYSYLAASLAYIRMPLFTVISGFVYALRPVRLGDEGPFLRGKARRLLLPLLSVVTVTLVLSLLSGSQGSLSLPLHEWYRAYLWPYSHFWFLQAMLWVFISVVLLERKRILSTLPRWAAAVFVAALAKYALPGWGFFSFDGFLYLLPYFLLGLGLHRFSGPLSAPRWLAVAAPLAVLGLGVQQLGLWGIWSIDVEDKGCVLATVTGMTAAFTLVRCRVRVPLLVSLGGYSYAAYLFHHLGLSAGKHFCIWLGLTSFDGLLMTKWLCGLLAGVAAEHLLRPIPGLNSLLLGMSRPRRSVTPVRSTPSPRTSTPPRPSMAANAL